MGQELEHRFDATERDEESDEDEEEDDDDDDDDDGKNELKNVFDFMIRPNS